MSSIHRRLSAHLTLTPQGLLRNAILSFDTKGKLLAITVSEAIDREAKVEFYDGILLPGLVNAHCHLELSYLRGRIPPHCGFAGFADAIARERHAASVEERDQAMTYWHQRMAYEGVVAVGDHCNGERTFALKAQSPIHYYNFIEGFGLRQTDFSHLERLAAHSRALGCATSITPHSTYSLQDAPFRRLSALDSRLSLHFMESRGESELFHQQGDLYLRNQREGFPVDFLHYGSPTERVIASIASDRALLLVHNTWVDDEEIEQLLAHFAQPPTWVLCPRSNAYIEGATPPVERLMRHGCRIALGTDSLASNTSLSLIDEAKLLPSSIPLESLLQWITRTGAEALGMQNERGSFELGKRPGVTLLKGIDWAHRTLRPDATTQRVL